MRWHELPWHRRILCRCHIHRVRRECVCPDTSLTLYLYRCTYCKHYHSWSYRTAILGTFWYRMHDWFIGDTNNG